MMELIKNIRSLFEHIRFKPKFDMPDWTDKDARVWSGFLQTETGEKIRHTLVNEEMRHIRKSAYEPTLELREQKRNVGVAYGLIVTDLLNLGRYDNSIYKVGDEGFKHGPDSPTEFDLKEAIKKKARMPRHDTGEDMV